MLNFVIGDEYHLKKLGIGAHIIKVTTSPFLKRLHNEKYNVVSCGNYVILFNLTDKKEDDVVAILFNCLETKLCKNNVLFQIQFLDDNNDKTDVDCTQPDEIVEFENLNNNDDDDKPNVERNLESFSDDGDVSASKRQKLDDDQQN